MKLCDAVAQISFLFTKIQVERNCVKHTPHTNLVIESVYVYVVAQAVQLTFIQD